MSALPSPAPDSPQCKDSCQYALGVAEQFLTLASDESVLFHANPRLTRLSVTEQHKIEALALWPGAGGALVLGSDDEASGGAVRIGW